MDYRSILDGSQRGFRAFVLRFSLGIFAIPYRFVIWIRNSLYDTGRLAIYDSPIPVISIGNLTAGGTGKTPLVAAIAGYLRAKSYRVALLSRGYRSDETGSNDEARELFDRLPDVPHLQDPDRVASAKIACEELDMEVLLVDDGFQHRRLGRDLDIVLVDATCPWGGGRLLPAGLLREPLSSLRRAQVVLITRANRSEPNKLQAIIKRIKKIAPQATIAQSEHVPQHLRDHAGRVHPVTELSGKRIIAFAGIGNPKPFFASLAELGAQVIATRSLPDHCAYDRETVTQLTNWVDQSLFAATSMPTDSEVVVVCTHKDLVKLRTARIGKARLFALQIELQLTENAADFWKAIDATIAKKHH